MNSHVSIIQGKQLLTFWFLKNLFSSLHFERIFNSKSQKVFAYLSLKGIGSHFGLAVYVV